MRSRGDRTGVVGVVLGILLLAAGVPLLVPSWVLERMQTPPAPKAEPPRPPEEAPARPREESAKDSGPLELPHAPE